MGYLMDEDIKDMPIIDLQIEIMKLRNGIRTHRDQKGDENCWLDGKFYLYGLLPERVDVDPQLPNKQLMMVNCSRFYDCKKAGKDYYPLKELPRKLEFAVEWIDIKERIPPFDTWVVVMNIDNYEVCCAYNETYDEVVMTRIDAGKEYDSDGVKIIYRQVPFEITHWFPLPWYPEKKETL